MIEVRNIRKSFGSLEVLKGIDLDIRKGGEHRGAERCRKDHVIADYGDVGQAGQRKRPARRGCHGKPKPQGDGGFP